MPTNPEQPIYQPTPENVWLNLKTILGAAIFIFSVGSVYAQGKAVSTDVEQIKHDLVRKADKDKVEVSEKRLQMLEQFVAVQVKINEAQEKANELQAKANEKNETQHDKIIEKLDKALKR